MSNSIIIEDVIKSHPSTEYSLIDSKPTKSQEKKAVIIIIIAILILSLIITAIPFLYQARPHNTQLNSKSQGIHYSLFPKVISQLQANGAFSTQEFNLIYQGKDEFFEKPSSPISKQLQFIVQEDSNSELTVIISDNKSFYIPENDRFPSTKQPIFQQNNSLLNVFRPPNKLYRVEINPNSTDLFTIYRDETNEVLFSGSKLIYSALYSYIETSINNDFIYGFGERRKTFRYSTVGNYTIYPKDQFAAMDHGQPGQQTYGYHPMWLKREQSDYFHAGFLVSSSPLMIEVHPNNKLGFHIVGGQIKLKFFIGDSNPETAINAYHRYINGYSVQPFWAFGYHQSRWGYYSSQKLLEIRDEFDMNDHPLDTLWNDLDYMVDYEDFVVNPAFNSEEMNNLTNLSSPNGVQWVPLIDMGIATNSPAAIDGIINDVFLPSSVYKHPLIGCVWPGKVYFPDFNNPKTAAYWNNSLNALKAVYNISASGYWIDMNEHSSFIAGEVRQDEECPGANPPSAPPVKPEIDDSLYIPVDITGNNQLANKSITIATQHYDQSDALYVGDQEVQELHFHPINALSQAEMTYASLGSAQPFILSRSTMYGAGRYVAHWTGDNYASWDFLKLAVAELLPFQLFGVPTVGQDLCGFAGNTNPQLCVRWLQLGAWTTFSRNHNDNQSISQEPFAFKNHTYVLEGSRKAFKQRYQFLKWIYSLYLRNFNQDDEFAAGTIMKPIWFEFPKDELAYQFENEEFMLGEELLISPVLLEGSEMTNSTTIRTYLPEGANWLLMTEPQIFQGGQLLKFTVRFDEYIPFFLREGYLVLKQSQSALRTRHLNNDFTLIAHMKKQNTSFIAVGTMAIINNYSEETVKQNCLAQNCITHIKIIYNTDQDDASKHDSLSNIKIESSKQLKTASITISRIELYGINESSIIIIPDEPYHLLTSKN